MKSIRFIILMFSKISHFMDLHIKAKNISILLLQQDRSAKRKQYLLKNLYGMR